jgi:oligoribonuclease
MSKPLFWVDLEMTGLDEKVDTILEVAIIITDIDFKPLEEYHRIVFQPQDVLDKMNDWCKKTHGDSGLTAAVAAGTPLATVEKEILELIGRHYKPNDRAIPSETTSASWTPTCLKSLNASIID